MLNIYYVKLDAYHLFKIVASFSTILDINIRELA